MTLAALVAALVPLTFMINWLVDGLKDVTNKNWNGLITKVTAYVGAFAVISLYAHSTLDLGKSLAFVSRLPWQGLALASLAVAASGGTLADYLRARNPADTNVKDKLVP